MSDPGAIDWRSLPDDRLDEMATLSNERRVRTSSSPNARGVRTKQTILDAAEHSFAEFGFDGVSMRLVADRAAVLLGVMTYHFTTKETLFNAVITRRADYLNAARLEAMKAVPNDDLRGLLEAFIRPYAELMKVGGNGWRAYAKVIAVASQDARWADLGEQHFGAVGHAFIDRLQIAIPSADRDLLVRAYVHIVSVIMGMFAAPGLIDRFSHGRIKSDEFHTGLEPAIDFLAGGIRSITRRSS